MSNAKTFVTRQKKNETQSTQQLYKTKNVTKQNKSHQT